MSNRRRPQSAKSAVRITGSAARPLQSKEFDRLKNPRALGRPQSAGPSLSRSAPDLGWTITTGQSGQIHIPNSATGFIKSISDTSSYELDEDQKITMMFKPDMQFPWAKEQEAIKEAEETQENLLARGVPIRTGGQRLPHEVEVDKAVGATLGRVRGFVNQDAVLKGAGFSASYYPVSKLWELRNKDRLLTNVRPAHLRKVSSGSFVICAGQMQDWRRRETNLMQLMTLLHRTCALDEEALDKVRQLLVSLCGGSAQNPIITPQRLVDILKVVRSNVHSGDDGDFFQRVLRVWDKNGDMRLTFSEMLDGLAVLLGGDARQKLEIFFLMYQHADPTRVGSGMRVDRQKGSRGQMAVTASLFNIYRMMVAVRKQLVDPRLAVPDSSVASMPPAQFERRARLHEMWLRKANDALDRFMDNLRSGDSGDLTFNELYIKISQPRHAWLVTILGEDCAEPIDMAVLDTLDPHYVPPENDRSFERSGSSAGRSRRSSTGRPGSRGPRGRGRAKAAGAGMSFRRNVASQKSYHSGAATAAEAMAMATLDQGKTSKRIETRDGTVRKTIEADHVKHMAVRGKLGRELLDSVKSVTRGGPARAVPMHLQALAAAQQAGRELANGLEWQYDDSLPGAARSSAMAGAGISALAWKRYDEATERAVEASFQAQTTHVTMSSATWRLGEEFLQREGDGVCSIALVPENMEVDGLSWHGYLQTNKRSGRIRRVRRIYNVAGRIGLLDDGTLEAIMSNIGATSKLDNRGMMGRKELERMLKDHELVETSGNAITADSLEPKRTDSGGGVRKDTKAKKVDTKNKTFQAVANKPGLEVFGEIFDCAAEEKASVIEVLQNLRKLALNATFDSLDPAGNGLRSAELARTVGELTKGAVALAAGPALIAEVGRLQDGGLSLIGLRKWQKKLDSGLRAVLYAAIIKRGPPSASAKVGHRRGHKKKQPSEAHIDTKVPGDRLGDDCRLETGL